MDLKIKVFIVIHQEQSLKINAKAHNNSFYFKALKTKFKHKFMADSKIFLYSETKNSSDYHTRFGGSNWENEI